MRRRTRAAALGLVLALGAAACGGDDGGGNASTAESIDENVKAGVKDQLGGSSTTEGSTSESTAVAKGRPTSIDDWESLWATERAAAVKKITDNDWGVSADGKTLTGPEGFTVDLSACANNWSNTEGLTDTAIKIGAHHRAVGHAGGLRQHRPADAGHGSTSTQRRRRAFKDCEGKTRKIDYIVKDDGYDPARTIPLVDELIDSEKVFAMWTLGSPNGLKVYDKLNERCVPHPLEMSGPPGVG